MTQDIVSGETFNFRYKARNIFGWSDYSESVAIIASDVPSQPLNIVTANNEAATTVTITWTLPTDTGGNGIPIDSYLVSVQDYS